MADEDEYDLEAVEAQLARMRQRRSNRLHATHTHTQVAALSRPLQEQPTVAPATTSEFELDEAGLSSHGSDSEDDASDCDSNTTNSLPSDDETRVSGRADPCPRRLRAAKRPKMRLRDSLDLSMSIAELPRPQKARGDPHKSADTSLSGPKSAQEQQLDKQTARITQSGQGSLGETGHSSRGAGASGDDDGDAWTSNLMRRRRQLEKDTAFAKDQSVNSAATVVAQSSNQAFIRDAKHRGILSKNSTSVSSPQEARPSAPGNYTNQQVPTNDAHEMGGCDHSSKAQPLSKHPVAASPSLMVKQEPRPSKRHEPPPPVPARALRPREQASATTKSHVEATPSRSSAPAAQSYLKPLERYATKAPLVSTSAIASSNVATARAYSSSPIDLQANPRTSKAMPVKLQLPEVLVRANVDCSSKSSSKAQAHVHFACPEEEEDGDDDDDLLSAEEDKLRQSLEKLDSRLTQLNSDTKQQQQQLHKRDKVVPQGCRTTGVQSCCSTKATARALSTRGSRNGDSSIEVADFVDDNVVAAGSYGGGAHCKSGQMTSALERSCYTRRAEMSSGLHKLRVRTGGAMAQESSSANLDKDGKHKVVVKKDLAHLLF